MKTGVQFKAYPTKAQKLALCQWMGCARAIWNAKCEENKYYTQYARKYHPIGTYAPVDATYSQFKDNELTPWLKKCPSQILRNSATNWYKTYCGFMQGENGKPKRKPKGDKGSIYLTNELYRFEQNEKGDWLLYVGVKRNNIGVLEVNFHREFEIPKSLTITRKGGDYFVSFCYDLPTENNKPAKDQEQLFQYFQSLSEDQLQALVKPMDRGVVIAVQTDTESYDFTPEQKRKMEKTEKYIKRQQKKLSRQVKGSNRRKKTKHKIGKAHKKIRNIRKDFCHKTSRAIVDSAPGIVGMEDLKVKNMTKRPKAKQDENGKYLKNNAAQKAGLNKSILNKGWGILGIFTQYKAARAGKAVFKIAPNGTSQECAKCHHTHPDNRKTQAEFKCVKCGHVDNADHNAAEVIKYRTVKLVVHAGTVLSSNGRLDTGRGADRKTEAASAAFADGNEASTKEAIAA